MHSPSGGAIPIGGRERERFHFLLAFQEEKDNLPSKTRESVIMASRRPRRPFRNQDTTLRRILTSTRTIALVGASDKPDRPSHEVMEFLLKHGYRVIPINPRLQGQELLGQKVLASLDELPQVLGQERVQSKENPLTRCSQDNDDDGDEDDRIHQPNHSSSSSSVTHGGGGGVMVDIFRRSDSVSDIVDQAIALGPGIVSSIWMQIGVIDERAARRAMEAGFDVAMNTCPVEEIPRLGIPVPGTATKTTGTPNTTVSRKRPKGRVAKRQRIRAVNSRNDDEPSSLEGKRNL